MIIIGEKINGAIPSVAQAIREGDRELIRQRVLLQTQAGADFLDCAPSTETGAEYDCMVWLLEIIQEATQTPVCIDSPDARLLARVLESGLVKRPGMVNSVNEESDKCEVLFPLIAGTPWQVVGLTSGPQGVPPTREARLDIAKSIIAKADKYGVALENLHIDPCVMSLPTTPAAMEDFLWCIRAIHDYAPQVKVTGAISNVSYGMPARKFVNRTALALALDAGLDSAIVDPTSADMLGTIYAGQALKGLDKGGRKYNRAYRQGKFG